MSPAKTTAGKSRFARSSFGNAEIRESKGVVLNVANIVSKPIVKARARLARSCAEKGAAVGLLVERGKRASRVADEHKAATEVTSIHNL
jgi:hypothetical protein